MDEASTASTKDVDKEEEAAGLLEWLALGAAAAPWAWVAGVLVSARDPSKTRLGFSGYVTNPSASLIGGGGGGPGGKPPTPDVFLDPAVLPVPPIPGPRSILVTGQFFVPYEFIAIIDDGNQVDTAQADVNGRLGYVFTPAIIVEGWHTLTLVDLDYGVRVDSKWFGFFPHGGRT